MKSSPKLYNFDALYENCKETFENPKGTPLQKKSKFRKKISVVCLNVEIPTGKILNFNTEILNFNFTGSLA